jgi:imidazolonepropionase-like amidohydrolase
VNLSPPEKMSLSESLRSSSTSDAIWLRVGTLFDGVSDQPIKNAHVVYDTNGIRYVSQSEAPPSSLLSQGKISPDAELPDHVLLPGLIEAHAHIFLDGAPVDFELRKKYLQQESSWMLERGRQRLQKIVETGVIAIRDAGDNRGVGLALKEEYEKGTLKEVAPYLESPGSAIHRKGRYGSFMSEAVENYPTLKDCVIARCQQGADRIKIIATGIIDFQKGAVVAPPQMSVEDLRLLAQASHELKKQTFAHASGTSGIENVIEGGIDTVEHAYFVTREQLMKMRDRQIAWVPTLAPVQIQIDRATELKWSPEIVSHLKKIVESHMKSLQEAQTLGVPVVAGSDAGSCGVPHGLGFLTELELMQRAGMSPLHILQSATGKSARFLKLKEAMGEIAVGKKARFILTKHSPLETVANLRKAKTVVFDGKVLEVGEAIKEEGL